LPFFFRGPCCSPFRSCSFIQRLPIIEIPEVHKIDAVFANLSSAIPASRFSRLQFPYRRRENSLVCLRMGNRVFGSTSYEASTLRRNILYYGYILVCDLMHCMACHFTSQTSEISSSVSGRNSQSSVWCGSKQYTCGAAINFWLFRRLGPHARLQHNWKASP